MTLWQIRDFLYEVDSVLSDDQISELAQEIFNNQVKPEEIAAKGLEKGLEEGFDTVLVDTAGRLQIDSDMMDEIVRITEAVTPDEVLLVVDSMIRLIKPKISK